MSQPNQACSQLLTRLLEAVVQGQMVSLAEACPASQANVSGRPHLDAAGAVGRRDVHNPTKVMSLAAPDWPMRIKNTHNRTTLVMISFSKRNSPDIAAQKDKSINIGREFCFLTIDGAEPDDADVLVLQIRECG